MTHTFKKERIDSRDHPLVGTARTLFLEYAQELGIDLCFQGFEEELATLPGKYQPPTGVLFILLDQDEAIACGALRDLGENIGELKRIYIRPSHRGIGLGRQLTLNLVQEAKSKGYETVRLDTLRRLAPAIQLYRSLGFKEIPPYGGSSPNLDVVYFELKI